MKRYLGLVLCLIAMGADAQVRINALPASSGVTSTDLTIDDQSGTTRSATFAQVLSFIQANISVQCATLPALSGVITSSGCVTTWNSALSGDVATSVGSFVTTIQPGVVTLAKQANLAADTIECNATTSAATPQACNPLAAANLMSAVISVTAIATTNITLSGTQTIDGVALAAGQSILTVGQTTTANNGLYIVQSGAWTRPINFPTGYVIAQNCDMAVFIRQGTAKTGHTYRLTTSGGTITIGTTNQSWSDSGPVIAAATASVLGTVTVSDTGSTQVPSLSGGATAVTDCVGFASLGGGIADTGNVAGSTGPCVVSDANGHPLIAGNGGTPAVTGTGCSAAAGTQRDNTGAIIAAGIDSCTLTFSSAFAVAPFCTVSGVGATVLPRLHALPTTALATFDTAAAGTFTYTCL